MASRRAIATRRQRSRGALELARTGMTAEQIADRCGKSRPQVTRWLNGERRPADANRAELLAEFGIDPAAWDDVPESAPPAAAVAAAVAPAAPTEPVSTRERALELHRLVHELMTSVGADAGSTPLEKAKVYASTATTLQLIGRLTGEAQDISERRLLSLPAWRRIEDRMMEVLKGHPKAAREIAAALEELGE